MGEMRFVRVRALRSGIYGGHYHKYGEQWDMALASAVALSDQVEIVHDVGDEPDGAVPVPTSGSRAPVAPGYDRMMRRRYARGVQ
jgi:hypothetical protein